MVKRGSGVWKPRKIGFGGVGEKDCAHEEDQALRGTVELSWGNEVKNELHLP
jgi:hypothetical protein